MAYNSSSAPYASSGAALSEVGYLLRSRLSVQKIKEIKTKVVDAPAQRDGDVDYSGFVDIFDAIDTVNAFGT